jgi:hypothetical protein
LPPALAARFTVSELAVLKVVGEEVKLAPCFLALHVSI